MSDVLVDRLSKIVFHNGIIRIDCIAVGPDNEERPSGTLLIPANQIGVVIQTLVNSTQELEKRIKEQMEKQSTPTAGNA